MEQSELEKLIEEVESRVDRLRSLYEQYFMGLERILPSVAQKDVERRLYVLRRQTIRNTALRFRFQNVLLKYNTYQMYWMRITRQIEEGTYKRDVRRAKARFAAPAPRDDAPEVESEELDLDVALDLEAEVASFEDEELERAREEVARMRAALTPPKAPKPPPLREPPPTDPGIEPTTEPRIPAASPAVGTYAARGRRRTSDSPLSNRGPISFELDEPPASVARPPRPRTPSSRPNAGSGRNSSRPPRPTSSRPDPLAPPSGRSLPRPQAPPRAAPPRPSPPKPPPGLSDERVRQLYTQYVEAKRKVGESTAAITYESLSRSLRDSSEKLKEKHGGKSVDFEVTTKNGKTVLRPVVK